MILMRMKHLPRLILTLMFTLFFAGNDSLTSGTSFDESEILTSQEELELNKILSADRIRRLDSLLNVYTSVKGFNGNVLVAISGYKVFERASGYADPLRKEPVSSASVYQLASVSKQFTAAAVMLLKSDGRLDFDDMVVDYIPELPYPGVRISHLLHHTGGLPNYMYLIDKYWSKNYPPDTEDVIAMLERYRLPAFFKPGSRYDYSNTGYVVLAALVERITGMSLNEFLQRRVFIPLGMKNTYVYSSADSNLVKRHIDGFRALKSGYLRIQESKSNGPVGDKGVCSTLEDLYIWDQALYSGFPISSGLLDEAFSPVRSLSGKEIPYGYGFRLRTYNKEKVVYHNGVWEGFRSNFHRYPESRNTIIVLNNTSTRINHELVSQIESIIHNYPVEDITRAMAGLALEKGCEEAYDFYLFLEDTGQAEQVDIERLAEVSTFMQQSGKATKAGEINRLISRIQGMDRS